MVSPKAAPGLTIRSWFIRPVRDVYRHRQLMLLAMLVPFLLMAPGGRPVWWLPGLGMVLYLLLTPSIRDPYRARLAAPAHRFRTSARRRSVVHYDPALDPFEVALFHSACEQEIEALERLFGVRFRPWRLYRPRLRVYLFPSAEEVIPDRTEPLP